MLDMDGFYAKKQFFVLIYLNKFIFYFFGSDTSVSVVLNDNDKLLNIN